MVARKVSVRCTAVTMLWPPLKTTWLALWYKAVALNVLITV